jgi:hypothetical protein
MLESIQDDHSQSIKQSTMVKKIETKQDGRLLIYYSFIEHDNGKSKEEEEACDRV